MCGWNSPVIGKDVFGGKMQAVPPLETQMPSSLPFCTSLWWWMFLYKTFDYFHWVGWILSLISSMTYLDVVLSGEHPAARDALTDGNRNMFILLIFRDMLTMPQWFRIRNMVWSQWSWRQLLSNQVTSCNPLIATCNSAWRALQKCKPSRKIQTA